MFHNFLRIGT